MNKADWITRKLIFFMGKGGVGKTTLTSAVAHVLAQSGKRVLLCHVEQLLNLPQKTEQVSDNLFEITLNPPDCFREYITQKLKVKSLYTLFLGNKLMWYFEKAAPGVRQLVMTGKIWFERRFYDHVLVDMPSTGYALTMFQAPFNFSKLFPGGPVHRDAQEITLSLNNPAECAHVVVTLAEEMPLQESVELATHLQEKLPQNLPYLIVNRILKLDPPLHSQIEAMNKYPGIQESQEYQAIHFLLERQEAQQSVLKKFSQNITNLFASHEHIEIEDFLDATIVKPMQEQLRGVLHATNA